MTMYNENEGPVGLDVMIGNLSRNIRLSSIASSLLIARTGVILTDQDITRISNDLADLRERWRMSPDSVMDALIRNEPTLAEEW